MIETERKFLVKNLPPDFKEYLSESILQGYISTSKDKTQMRLRQSGSNRYTLTVKTKTDHEMQREETEVALTADQFSALWPAVGKRTLRKIRRHIQYKSHVLLLDVYQGNLSGLITVEVEFPSLEKAHAFNPPCWAGKEITNNQDYGNRHMAEYGLP